MSDLSVTILPETPKDAQAIERLLERTFGPGRFVLSAYRLREHVDHLLDLSFTARIGTLMVGSVRQLPVCIGVTTACWSPNWSKAPSMASRGQSDRTGARRGSRRRAIRSKWTKAHSRRAHHFVLRQNFKFANARTPMPGIRTSSLV
jgi:hypothetical protein